MALRYATIISRFGVSIAMLLLAMNIASPNEIEKWLLMPGEVVAGHAEFEADCNLCHSPLDDTSQGTLCIDCHQQVAKDIDSGAGFHGRLPAETQLECATCHTDHEGRDANIVTQPDASFDHSLTDFQLRGAHQRVACDSCHVPGEPRHQAPDQCIDCHGSEDVHNGNLGTECASCHGSNVWTETRFAHFDTGFPLTGAHATTDCRGCHTSSDFVATGTSCVSCHAEDDIHDGENGNQCASCHVTANWIGITFDHLRVSNFSLTEGHADLTCSSCHRSESHDDLRGSSCVSCHAGDDAHEGRFGNDCASCHNNRRWSSAPFDHVARTGVRLPGGHESLACVSCHTGSLTDPLPDNCGGCHRDDDPHDGQLGSTCESCHAPTDWNESLAFDHGLANFPLLGKHADLSCDQCHASSRFHDADSACMTCHQEDDVHGGSLGMQCADCHNPASWAAWLFDHDAHTEFALTGAHSVTPCSSCHTSNNGVPANVPDDCVSCHRRDDRHAGRFGDNCGSCHVTDSFARVGGR